MTRKVMTNRKTTATDTFVIFCENVEAYLCLLFTVAHIGCADKFRRVLTSVS